MIVWRRRLPSMTLVTAILDLGRGEIASWGRRPYALYTTGLAQLLSRYRDVPVIVHVTAEDEPLVWRTRRRDNTRVVPTTRATLGALPWYGRVDAIRTSPSWADRAEWLRESPQRLLDGYLALVLAKLRWLCDAATANPFGTERFVWMDGGLPRNPSYAHLSRRGFVRGLDIERFRVLTVPYTTNEEIHGFDRRACAQYCGTEFVSWIVRGGLFGGTGAAVAEVSELYDALVDETLAHGHLGTEETLLTILAHRHPTLFQRHCLEGNR